MYRIENTAGVRTFRSWMSTYELIISAPAAGFSKADLLASA